ncbi:hypothetical protein [Arthrobacter globiformis]|uniref:hypothetical protein n=1 Tax=Arthrobacter globiformis TaxID=1665 RepID=UPI00278FD61C|nr:hypothetical protein [Arthrobacter globiformis]MDQ0618616.1 hypothetical protein [Arthrobacter globiformis]
MATGAGKDGNKYEWQSWPPDSLEGMPSKRRRLVRWTVFFWFILLSGMLGSGAEAAGIGQPWRSLLVAGVLAAIFGPLIRGAVLEMETRQLRAESQCGPGRLSLGPLRRYRGYRPASGPTAADGGHHLAGIPNPAVEGWPGDGRAF